MKISRSQIKIDSCGITAIGKVRKNNEDSFVMDKDAGRFCVIDGMGGHNGGEVAAEISARVFQDFFSSSEDASINMMIDAFVEADKEVIRNSRGVNSGMGAVAAASMVGPGGKVIVGHCGDARVYLYRRRLKCLTVDIASWDGGIIGPLGHGVEVEVNEFDYEIGDKWMVCSDGIYGYQRTKGDIEIEQIMRDAKDASSCCKNLIKNAMMNGGQDNSTCICFFINKK